ncbi:MULTISPECIES: AAA family ATPase [Cytobacillus]|uniref:ATPase n=1 Tax=Cytobacillus oceanisediminis TaxID=665099 RepID=A0ABX3CL58_9BACI|nr:MULTISPECIES: ATP-binding protein [Cytobacillus]OHX41423.1 ATPase [Cytobacillus oceanisediminis]
MYNEILKIIEGGLKGDKDRVANYTKLFIKNLENEGNEKLANKIAKILKSNNTRLVELDSFSSKPVDQDSRMEMVSVTIPTPNENNLIMNKFVKHEIEDFISSYQNKEKLLLNNIEQSNKILMYGKPGTGKTSLAHYISCQVNLPLVTARLDGLVSSLLGNTAKNIRRIFDYAKKSPCVLFLDEFDVIAKIRDDKNELGELKRVVNSLLQNIDDFDNGSILVAATNHEQLLDPAVWRRFDKVIELPLPNDEERNQIIKEYTKNLGNNFIEDPKKLKSLIISTSGFSPSDIKLVINNAIRKVVLKEKGELKNSHILYEIFLVNNRNLINEERLIIFLLKNGISQREINLEYDISLRKIRECSKKLEE